MGNEKMGRSGGHQQQCHSDLLLRCPVCGGHIFRAGTAYTCENGHTFDIARQGYVNLLLAHQRKSKQPGDSKEMVLARARFLERGYYQPIADALNKTVSAQFPTSDRPAPGNILDAGCGEGYYLARLQDDLPAHLLHQQSLGCFVGLDISKAAIREAARRSKEVSWIVASVIHMPFQSGSFRLITSVFAPTNLDEFVRVLEPDGKLILVTPGPHHLHELRQLLYEEVVEHSQEDFLERAHASFKLVHYARVTFDIHLLNTADILSLFQMTPYFWKSSAEARTRVERLDQLETQVDVSIRVLQVLSIQS